MSRAGLIVPTSEIIPVTPEPVRDSEPDVPRRRNSIGSEQIDWGVAVHAARVLLDETFGSTGSIDNSILTDMAQELAARLCAYDEIVGAVEHMQACLPGPPDYL